MIKRRQGNVDWLQSDKQLLRVVSLYDYNSRNSDELSFREGTIIYLAPSSFQSTTSNWLLGTIDRVTCGLIPANYVQVLRQQPNTMLRQSSAITLHPQQPIIPPPPPPSQASEMMSKIDPVNSADLIKIEHPS